MKELSIEEKAQRYDEAIERAESIYNETAIPSATTKGICTYIFPELKESEDERIRKDMIFYFQEEIPQCSIQEHSDKMREFISWLKRQEIECIKLELKAGNSYFCYKSRWERTDNETFKKGLIYKCNKDGVLDNFVIKNPEQHFIEIKDERIAWLEKQGNLMKALQISNARIGELIEKNYYLKEQLEKQGEQNPADKAEPKFKVGDVVTNKKSKDTVKIVQILHDSYCYSGWDGAATVHSDFSISEQDDWELVELTAWSEEGGQKYSEDSCKKSNDIAAEEKAEYKKGFECGKQLVLKYPEDFDLCKKTLTDWSEEDEEMMSSTVFYLNEFKEVYQEGAQKCISWLKSLKDRVQPQPKQEWSEEDDEHLETE